MTDENDAPVYVLQFTSDFFADVRKGWEHSRLHANEEVAGANRGLNPPKPAWLRAS